MHVISSCQNWLVLAQISFDFPFLILSHIWLSSIKKFFVVIQCWIACYCLAGCGASAGTSGELWCSTRHPDSCVHQGHRSAHPWAASARFLCWAHHSSHEQGSQTTGMCLNLLFIHVKDEKTRVVDLSYP